MGLDGGLLLIFVEVDHGYILNVCDGLPPALRYLLEALVNFVLDVISEDLQVEENYNALVQLLGVFLIKRFVKGVNCLVQKLHLGIVDFY